MDDLDIDAQTLRDIDALEQVVALASVESEASEADATNVIRLIKDRLRALEDRRKLLTKPLNDRKREIDKFFKPYTSRLAQMEAALKRAIFASVQARETRNRESMLAAQAAAQTGAPVAPHLDAIDDRPLPPSTSIRRRWAYRVIDPAQVPGQYWSPDPAKIEAELAKHTDFARPPHIPGVEITVEGSVAVRKTTGA